MRAIYYYQATLSLKQFRPIAYSCSDYQSFIRGQCADCGQGNECAIFGEEAIKSIEMKNKTTGKRFYIMTSDKFPYFCLYFTQTIDFLIKIFNFFSQWIPDSGKYGTAFAGKGQ